MKPPALDSTRLLEWLLTPLSQEALIVLAEAGLEDWWQALGASGLEFLSTPARAIVGGRLAPAPAHAFVAGYQWALRALVPTLDEPGLASLGPASLGLASLGLASLCVTEAGGGHPRAIQTLATALSADEGGGFRLSGRKQWATCSVQARSLLVVACTGQLEHGHPQLMVLKVPGDAPGVRIEPMPPTPFLPEVQHGILHLEQVWLPVQARLPGDGYDCYVKPFRTVEDLHVHAALLGHLWRIAEAFDWPKPLREQLLGLLLLLHSLALEPAQARGTHLALAGVLLQIDALLEACHPHWDGVTPALRERWARDIAVRSIASRAREQRRDKAWHIGSSKG